MFEVQPAEFSWGYVWKYASQGREFLVNVKNKADPFLQEISDASVTVFEKIQPYTPYLVMSLGAVMVLRGLGDLTRSKPSKIESALTVLLGLGAFIQGLNIAYPPRMATPKRFVIF